MFNYGKSKPSYRYLQMPRKNGRLTPPEIRVIDAAAATGQDVTETARRAGVSVSGAWRAMQRPAVQDAIRREQQARLFNEVLPLAVEAHVKLLTDPATPAGARAQAVGLAYKHALPGVDLDPKDVEKLTGDELAALATQIRQRLAQLANDAKPIVDNASGDVFD